MAVRPPPVCAVTVPRTTVTHRAQHVAIVATGPSLKGVTLHIPDGVTVIAVNDAIKHIPRTDFWFTSDFAHKNQETMTSPLPGVTYYAAIWTNYLHHYGNQDKVGHVLFLERIDGKDYPVGYEKAMPGLAEDKGQIHAGNSAYGAMGLAYHMGARDIALLGVDGTLDPYAWGEGKPKGTMAHLPSLFASALPQLQAKGVTVINGSPKSAVTCFPRCDPNGAMGWLGERVRRAA